MQGESPIALEEHPAQTARLFVGQHHGLALRCQHFVAISCFDACDGLEPLDSLFHDEPAILCQVGYRHCGLPSWFPLSYALCGQRAAGPANIPAQSILSVERTVPIHSLHAM